MKLIKSIFMLAVFLGFLGFAGCLISDVDQTKELKSGEIFTATLTISDIFAETTTPHKGVLMVLVPDDWTFVSGTFQTTIGSGKMVLNTSTPYVYGDIDTVIQAPTGMKWIHLLSDTGYLYQANFIMETTVNFKVGKKTGTFPIGYACTKNTMNMLVINKKDVDNDGAWTDTCMNNMVKVNPSTSVREEKTGLPQCYNLAQNFPNPFNPSTSISYSVVKPGDVSLVVYDASGKEVEKLVQGYRSTGSYNVMFNASNLASGIYYYTLKTGGIIETKKMVLLK